jgi:hypothetical protein
MARNPATTWELLNVAMSHYQSHIGAKSDRCSLSIIDLLHVSNFKGGNASITEPVSALPAKLKHYEKVMLEIEEKFGRRSLSSLNREEVEVLKTKCNGFLALTQPLASNIRGFGPSYASALLAAHFLDLIPVLDRRALNGAGISVVKDSQGQVKEIAKYYGQLIDAFKQELSKSPGLTLRELDKKWFSKDL